MLASFSIQLCQPVISAKALLKLGDLGSLYLWPLVNNSQSLESPTVLISAVINIHHIWHMVCAIQVFFIRKSFIKKWASKNL